MEWRGIDRVYAAGQGIALTLYAAIYLLDGGPLLFTGAAWRAIGLAACLGALILMALAIVTLSPVIQVAPQPRDDGRLISSGVYRHLRHPMYTAILFLVGGLFLRKPTIGLAVAGVLIAVFLAMKTRYEERLLTARYPEYPDYRRRTFGLFPIVRG